MSFTRQSIEQYEMNDVDTFKCCPLILSKPPIDGAFRIEITFEFCATPRLLDITTDAGRTASPFMYCAALEDAGVTQQSAEYQFFFVTEL